MPASTPPRRRASTTAPTAATSSRNEAISNGARNFVSSSVPIAAGVPKPGRYGAPLVAIALQAGSEHGDEQLDGERAAAGERGERRDPARVLAERLRLLADVLDDEHVQHHHGAGVDDDLREGDELGAQQQEQRRQRDQVRGQREHAVERLGERDHADRARDGDDRGDEEDDVGHQRPARAAGIVDVAPAPYSPSARSGVASIGSASSISLVKMRSERL